MEVLKYMDVKQINPFLKAFENAMGQFGVCKISKGAMNLCESMSVRKDITAFIGVIGDVKGAVSYSFDKKTAMNMASILMMGMPVAALGDMEKSALAELANILAGNALTLLYEEGFKADITTPSVVMKDGTANVYRNVKTLAVSMDTEVGTIEINFGFEM